MGMAGNVNIVLALALCFSMVSSDAANAIISDGQRRDVQAVGNEAFFNVLQFGAKPGRQSSTLAFIRAWNAACSSPGRARVVIPAGEYTLGETVFQGPCNGPIKFHLMGTLKAITDITEYSEKRWIAFDSISGLTITGGGTINGQGEATWKYDDCKTNPNCVHLPASLYFNNVQNAKVKGVNLVNSMGFHMHVTGCSNFKAHSLHITAPGDSPNTDGIHFSRSNHVQVSRSVIGTGDDCISIGHGSVNVTITKIICGPGHGISIGSLGKVSDEQDVSQVLVRNCTLKGTTNGVRIKTWPESDPSKATGILFSDIIMEDVEKPIIIDQGYGTHSDKPSLVKISNVVYQNIRGTTTTPTAVNLKCSSQVPCENIHLNNINLVPVIGVDAIKDIARFISNCTNARVIYSGIQIPPPCFK